MYTRTHTHTHRHESTANFVVLSTYHQRVDSIYPRFSMFTSFRRANTQSSVITRIPYSSHYPLQSVSSNSGSVMQFRTCLTGLGEQSIDPSIEWQSIEHEGSQISVAPSRLGREILFTKIIFTGSRSRGYLGR